MWLEMTQRTDEESRDWIMSIWNHQPGKRKQPAKAVKRGRSFQSKIEIDEVGRLIKVHDQRLFRAGRRQWCRKLVEGAASRPGVDLVRLDLNSASFEIQFAAVPPVSASPARVMADVFADAMSEADAITMIECSNEIAEMSARSSRHEEWTSLTAFPGTIELDQEPTLLTTGPKRGLYLFLGGSSFAMIFVGLAVPGIPTVPFVMASSYYLARSSRRLHGMLARSGTFGPIVVEWSKHHGLSRMSKAKLAGLAAIVVGISFLLVPLTPLVLIMTFALSSAGLYSLIRLPGIDDDTQPLALQSISKTLPAALA
jgi:uncharacterized membrane protein YbaN (DUF454 family)